VPVDSCTVPSGCGASWCDGDAALRPPLIASLIASSICKRTPRSCGATFTCVARASLIVSAVPQ
jgi:hypothetical protein